MEQMHPADAATIELLRRLTTEWQELDDEGRKELENNDIRLLIASLITCGAIEQRLSYKISKQGRPGEASFCVEVCGDFSAKVEALCNQLAQNVWGKGFGYCDRSCNLEAVRDTIDGKHAIECYDAGNAAPLREMLGADALGRMFLVGQPKIETTPKQADKATDGVIQWSAPATMAVWCKRFGNSDRTLRKWRILGSLRMESVKGQRGKWRVDESDPLYIEWSKDRKSLD